MNKCSFVWIARTTYNRYSTYCGCEWEYHMLFSIAIIVKPVFEWREVIIHMQQLVRTDLKSTPLSSLTHFEGHI
jgi:hypothetical protein